MNCRCRLVNVLTGFALVLILSSGSALAATVTVNFAGTIGGFSAVLSNNPFTFSDPISGSYTYDTSVPDSNGSTTVGLYVNALTAFTLDLGNGATGSITSATNLTVVDSGGDNFQATTSFSVSGPDQVFSDGVNTGTYSLSAMGLVMSGNDPLSNDGLTAVLPTSFLSSQFTLVYTLTSGTPILNGGFPTTTLAVDGRATSASFAAAIIPVPAALPLMLSGLAGLGLIGWRRRRDVETAPI